MGKVGVQVSYVILTGRVVFRGNLMRKTEKEDILKGPMQECYQPYILSHCTQKTNFDTSFFSKNQ